MRASVVAPMPGTVLSLPSATAARKSSAVIRSSAFATSSIRRVPRPRSRPSPISSGRRSDSSARGARRCRPSRPAPAAWPRFPGQCREAHEHGPRRRAPRPRRASLARPRMRGGTPAPHKGLPRPQLEKRGKGKKAIRDLSIRRELPLRGHDSSPIRPEEARTRLRRGPLRPRELPQGHLARTRVFQAPAAGSVFRYEQSMLFTRSRPQRTSASASSWTTVRVMSPRGKKVSEAWCIRRSCPPC